MAKTKEQKLAEQAEQARIKQLAEETYYKENLMKVLSQACNHDHVYVLTARQDVFVLEDTQCGDEFVFTLGYTKNSYNTLCDLELDLTMLEGQLRKQKELADLRKNALNKLSDEEREALGL
jgi:hypothetical protein